MDTLIRDAAIASIWTSWIVNLMIAQWWLDRKPQRSRKPGGKSPLATKVAVGV